MTEYRTSLAMLLSITDDIQRRIGEFNYHMHYMLNDKNLEIEKRLELIKNLKTELEIIKSDIEKAVLYFD
jgi:hypothetical protein